MDVRGCEVDLGQKADILQDYVLLPSDDDGRYAEKHDGIFDDAEEAGDQRSADLIQTYLRTRRCRQAFTPNSSSQSTSLFRKTFLHHSEASEGTFLSANYPGNGIRGSAGLNCSVGAPPPSAYARYDRSACVANAGDKSSDSDGITKEAVAALLLVQAGGAEKRGES